MVYLFSISERVESGDVVIVRGKFKLKELAFDKATVKIYARDNKDIFFMEGLMQHLQMLKNIMG
jgi:activator of HSP90 ATPase